MQDGELVRSITLLSERLRDLTEAVIRLDQRISDHMASQPSADEQAARASQIVDQIFKSTPFGSMMSGAVNRRTPYVLDPKIEMEE